MAIVQVQKKNGTSATGLSYPIVFTSTPTQNNLLIGVWTCGANNDPGAITAPSGWTIVTGFPLQRGALYKLVIAYKVAGAAESTTVSVGTANSVASIGTIFEYSGLTTSSPEDKHQTSDGGAGTLATLTSGTTAATTVADELVIAGWALSNTSGGTESATNSFTLENTSNTRNLCASKIVSATGAQETTAAWLTARTVVGGIVSFIAATTSITDGDAGTSADAGESIAAAVADAETATATDTELLAAAIVDVDTAASADAGESIAAGISDGDTATALDDMTITVLLSDADTATAVDTELLAAAISDADTAVVAEAEAIVAAIVDTELAVADDLLVVDNGIRRDIDYRVADAPTAWRAGDVDTAWEAADVPTAWKAGDA